MHPTGTPGIPARRVAGGWHPRDLPPSWPERKLFSVAGEQLSLAGDHVIRQQLPKAIRPDHNSGRKLYYFNTDYLVPEVLIKLGSY